MMRFSSRCLVVLVACCIVGQTYAADLEKSKSAVPNLDCELVVPKGEYAQIVLEFDVPGAAAISDVYARWSYVGAMRDGRMTIDHGIGLRAPGGVLELKDGRLTGEFAHSRKDQKRHTAVVQVSVDANMVGGAISGTAKIGEHTGKVTGRVIPEEELVRGNRLPADRTWPAFLGPAGGGAAAEATQTSLIQSVDEIRLVWAPEETDIGQGIGSISRFMDRKFQDATGLRTGSGSASPICADGRIYLSYYVPSPAKPPQQEVLLRVAQDGGVQPEKMPSYALEKLFPSADDVVLCMDAATGKTLWKATMPQRAHNLQHHKEGPFNLTPGYGDGRLFAIGMSGWLYAFDGATGKPLWQAELSNSKRSLYSATALVTRDAVIVPRKDKWTGLDPQTGEQLWQSDLAVNHATTALWKQKDRDCILVGAGGHGEVGGKIYCLAAATGQPQWTLDSQVLSHGRGLGPGGMSIYGDILLSYIREGEDKEPTAQYCTAWRLSATKPEQMWQVRVDGSGGEHVPVVVNKRFVFTGDLQAIELATGKVTARADGIKPENGGYLQAMGDLVLVRRDGTHGNIQTTFYRFSDDGKIACLNPDEPWTPHLGGTTTSYHHPIMYPLVDGRMFLRQYNGVYCWDLRHKAAAGSR